MRPQGLAQAINLEGLSEPLARVTPETVHNLKSCYRSSRSESLKLPKELPSHPGKMIGSLRRHDLIWRAVATLPSQGVKRAHLLKSGTDAVGLFPGCAIGENRARAWGTSSTSSNGIRQRH